MNDLEMLIRQAAARETLSSEEHERMRALLADYAAFKPRRDGARVHVLGLLLPRYARPVIASVAALAILSAGTGGVALAAEGTLPGDALYPVKVDVTEPIVGALTESGSASASWHMQIAERRLSEATALAHEGRLTHATSALLAKRIVDASRIADAELTAADPAAQAVASTSFTTRLSAYDALLSYASLSGSSTDEVHAAIRTAIGNWEPGISASTTATTSELAGNRKGAAHKRAAALESAAKAEILRAETSVASAKSVLGATTSAGADDALSKAGSLIEEGQSALEAGDDDAANRAFRASIDAATRLDVFTQAAASLRVNPFTDATTTASTTLDEATSSEGAAVLEGAIRAGGAFREHRESRSGHNSGTELDIESP